MYHMPIYRQLQRFAQEGVIISDTTMGDWINGVGQSLIALHDVHRQDVIYPACGYMMADETSMNVLDNDKQKGKKSHMNISE